MRADPGRDVFVGARANDELGRLARSFDGMLAALEMSLRSQRQLVADASHELRTPLTSLRTNLELLERGQPTDEDDRTQLLHDLVAQMERLSTLVADLIDLARDEEAPLPIEDVRLDEIAAEAADAVRFRYPKVRVVVEATESSVRGVRSRILRAVTNLVDNAAKWSPAGATVEVSVRSGEVSVRDHGPGIALEDRPRVFDRFWRAASARETGRGGARRLGDVRGSAGRWRAVQIAAERRARLDGRAGFYEWCVVVMGWRPVVRRLGAIVACGRTVVWRPRVRAFVTGPTEGVAVSGAFATGGCSGALALYACEVA